MTLELRIGDVFDRMAEIPDGSIDLIVTSPPFLALRSYLPADHPLKHKEIGSEATPADFLDTLLALTAEFGRVLAPHGSICVELGDTYSGSGGAGGDYAADGLRDGAPKFEGSAKRARNTEEPCSDTTTTSTTSASASSTPTCHAPMSAASGNTSTSSPKRIGNQRNDKQQMAAQGIIGTTSGERAKAYGGWPLAKSLTGIPTLYPWSLAYGRNLLTGQPIIGPPWRIRNVIVWARPNPPVGALGDKFRPATSYITVACRGPKRYFDLDAVRTVNDPGRMDRTDGGTTPKRAASAEAGSFGNGWERSGHGMNNPAGAPPLDWHADHHPEDGDWLWKMATAPFKGAHYASYPYALPKRLIEAMCPLRVCLQCGRPSERIVGEAEYIKPDGRLHRFNGDGFETEATGANRRKVTGADNGNMARVAPTLGWSDCGHDQWRTGICLDPFAGSGTTLEAAQAVGRHAIGIDLDPRNADLARSRVGMFLAIDEGAA